MLFPKNGSENAKNFYYISDTYCDKIFLHFRSHFLEKSMGYSTGHFSENGHFFKNAHNSKI